jgi:hypothetical protein
MARAVPSKRFDESGGCSRAGQGFRPTPAYGRVLIAGSVPLPGKKVYARIKATMQPNRLPMTVVPRRT